MNARAMPLPFVVWSDVGEGAGSHKEGERTSLKAAFSLARKRYREYKGKAIVVVRWEGTLIAAGPDEFTMQYQKAVANLYGSRMR